METVLPKISIITPSFNDSRYLEQTILSVLSQNYPNLEYIIIDGGSTDGSVDIIKKYADQLTFWISETDNGMYHALQKGFEKCTGEVMGWINSDDMLHPGSLFTIGQIFGDYAGINWIQGLPNVIDESNRIVYASSGHHTDKLDFYQKKHLQSDEYIQQESTFWRRLLWDIAGSFISQDYKYAGDFELWIRFFQHEKLYNLNALMGAFRTSKSGQASVENYAAYVDETLRILEHYPLSEKEKKRINTEQFFKKIESRVTRLKAWVLRKKHLDSTSVINHQLYFNSKLQKFDLNK